MPCFFFERNALWRVYPYDTCCKYKQKEYEKDVDCFVGGGRGALRVGTETAGDKRNRGRGARLALVCRPG